MSDLIERLKQVCLESCDSENAWIKKVAEDAIAALSEQQEKENQDCTHYDEHARFTGRP